MSISVSYLRASKEEVARVTVDQSAWDKHRRLMSEASRQVFESTLAAVKALPPTVGQEDRWRKMDELMERNRNPRQFGLEKDWQTVVYLLTGSHTILEKHIEGAPLQNLVFGGLPTGVKTGYGLVTVFDDKIVAETASALQSVDRQQIEERFDPAKMAALKIYAAPDAEEKNSIIRVIGDLAAFFNEANKSGESVVKYIT